MIGRPVQDRAVSFGIPDPFHMSVIIVTIPYIAFVIECYDVTAAEHSVGAE